MNNTIILDGSKFDWSNGTVSCDAIGRVDDHPGFPKSGRAPAEVAVRSHRTGAVVAFNFVEIADDGEGTVTLNYEGRLPDGRHCALSLAAD
jgi:hypothetical protein